MKIDSTHQTPASLKGPGCDTCQTAKTGTPNSRETNANSDSETAIVSATDRQDRVILSAGVSEKRAEGIYRMSDLKKKADEQLARLSAGAENIESIGDSFGDLDRQERVEIAKLRSSAGFYNREDVIDEIARRIADNIG